MIRIDDVHAIKLIARACNIQFVPHLHHCIARYNEIDQLMGGTLFTDYMGGSVQMHVAGFQPNWNSRTLMYLSFSYAFEQLGITKLIALIPEWNYQSRNNSLKMGYKLEYKIDDIFNHEGLPNGMYILSIDRKAAQKYIDMKPVTIEFAPRERINELPTIEQLTAIPAATIH